MKYIELNNCRLKIAKPQFANDYVKSVFDEIQKTWRDELKKELDEIKERLAKLEEKK